MAPNETVVRKDFRIRNYVSVKPTWNHIKGRCGELEVRPGGGSGHQICSGEGLVPFWRIQNFLPKSSQAPPLLDSHRLSTSRRRTL